MKYDLAGILDTSASSGGLTGTITITEGDEPALLADRFYINVHTAENGAGEIRGQLVVVPEPANLAIAMALGLFLIQGVRRVLILRELAMSFSLS